MTRERAHGQDPRPRSHAACSGFAGSYIVPRTEKWLVQALYAAGKENKAFLHIRFGLDNDVLKPYKATLSRWVCPDVMCDQDYSAAKAKKAISDYK